MQSFPPIDFLNTSTSTNEINLSMLQGLTSKRIQVLKQVSANYGLLPVLRKFYWNAAAPLIYILLMATFILPGQNGAVVTKTIWPIKYLISGPLQNRFADSCSKKS